MNPHMYAYIGYMMLIRRQKVVPVSRYAEGFGVDSLAFAAFLALVLLQSLEVIC